jgi:hypothetical protein
MKKHFSTPGIITIAILTIITAVFWTFFSVLRIFMIKEKDVEIPETILVPLNPQLNTSALQSLKSRKFIEEGQIPEIIYSEITEEIPPETEIVEEPPPEEPVDTGEETPPPSPEETTAPESESGV